MAQLPTSYTEYADQIVPQASFEPLPQAKYLAIVTESEWKDTKAGTGRYLQFTFEVVDGEHKGRKFWDRLNLENQNQTAVEIAHRTLSAICHAVGKVRARDSQELHNLPLVVDLALKQGTSGPMNEVKGYSAVNGAAPAGQPATTAAAPKPAAPWQQKPTAAPQAPPAAPATKASPPWAR